MEKLLVVVDMQNDFINGSLGSKEAQSILANVYTKILKYNNDPNGHVIFTQDTHEPDEYEHSEEGRKLPIKHCIKGTQGWELDSSILSIIDPKSPIFEKSAFGSKALMMFLSELEDEHDPYDAIELIGLCTDICVIANAVIAKSSAIHSHVIVDASCCAGTTPENHDIAIKAMKNLQIEIKGLGMEPWRK